MENPMGLKFALQDVAGRGKGLVAIDDIPKGTRILSEKPLISTPNQGEVDKMLRTSIRQQIDALNEQQRRAFLSMYNLYPYDNDDEQYLGIIRTNGLPGDTDTDNWAIFPYACRINHACDNNTQKNWNENIKQHTVHALTDIKKGEEITIYYLGGDKTYEDRRKALQEKFGFTCACRLCSLPRQQRLESDNALNEIHRLDRLIGQYGVAGILSTPLRILRYVDRQVRLYRELRPCHLSLPRAFQDAAQISIVNGDLARGRIFMERSKSVWETALGGDSPEVAQPAALAHDPSKHDLYGYSFKWKTSLDDISSGLEPSAFEDWLWKRQKPAKQPGQLVDLRDRATFPPFSGLPDENDIDPDLYETNGVGTLKQGNEWCFLGEIGDSMTIHHLEMEILDVDGKICPLHFYTDGLGTELVPSQIQKGYTVAVLLAKRRVFKFSEPGIRHEDPRMIKFIPTSLNNLLSLNDRVQQFSTELDGIRTCHGCAKEGTSMHRCSKCSFFWYCDRVTGWTEKGHKADCKLLRNPDLRGLFLLMGDQIDN